MPAAKKLIEVALPLDAINQASAREKSIRHGHPSTLHLWWARRPLAAARAVIFTSLVDDPDDDNANPAFVAACRKLPGDGPNVEAKGDSPRMRLFDFIERLVTWEATTDEKIMGQARQLIRIAANGKPPPLLDPFAGGGSIPLEAQRLGLEAHASDLNPVAVMINKAMIEIPPRFADKPPVNPRERAGGTGGGATWKGAAGLAADVRYYGEWMRERAFERIGHLYPKHKGETVIAWLWARTVISPNPAVNAPVPLVRSFVLSKKKGRECWARPVIEGTTVRFVVAKGLPPAHQDGTMGRRLGGGRCVISGEPISWEYVRAEGKAGRMGEMLMAIVTDGKRGRSYYSPDPSQAATAAEAENMDYFKPSGKMPLKHRNFQPPVYGMYEFGDLFTPRQLVALTTFSDLVQEAREQATQDALAAWGATPHPPAPSPTRGEGEQTREKWDISPELRMAMKEVARGLRKNATQAEDRLWQAIRRKRIQGKKFRRQMPIGAFVVDFYCPSERLAIEVDGGFHEQQVEADRIRQQLIESLGIRFLRLTNDEVMHDLPAAIAKIKQSFADLAQGEKSPSPPVGEGFGVGAEDDRPLREGGRGARAYGEAVSVYLAFAVDRIANTLCTIARWTPGRDQTVTAFARQAIPMTWDFPDVNPFSGAAGDLTVAIASMEKALRQFKVATPAHISQEDATTLSFNAVILSTDPPYYDNIGYADLSDFFYIWMRQNLRNVYPEIFSTVLVPKSQELIASKHRHGSPDEAKDFFESGMLETFKNIRRFVRDDFPLTVYYAFKQQDAGFLTDGTTGEVASTGWETMLASLIKSGFSILGTWPVRTECRARMNAMGTNALASSIVLVCRPRPEDAPATSRRRFQDELRAKLPDAIAEMRTGEILPVDLAQASIGPGMAIYSRYSRVLEANGDPVSVRQALSLINNVLAETLYEFVGEVDEYTRFAIDWFQQHQFEAGDAGSAETLALAKNTSLPGLDRAGLIELGGGKVRLLHWQEYDPGRYDPQQDDRPTVWEGTHHLIERLNTHGETGAAMLLTRMSPELAGAAQDLAFSLYDICDRNGWARHARDYNGLIASWQGSDGIASEAARLRSEPGQGALPIDLD